MLSAFVHKGMIYESADYHNAVFVGYDEHGIARHAHKRGTGSESTYKGNAESCDPRYSFHWTGTDNTLYLFEAPIDILIAEQPDVCDTVVESIMTDKLRKAILKLTDEEQLLIYRHYYADIPGTELAEIYGVSQQAISKRIAKIRVKLKNLLEK